jgi:hypothetical protein
MMAIGSCFVSQAGAQGFTLSDPGQFDSNSPVSLALTQFAPALTR